MAVITYLRVSTNDQATENQRRQIIDAGYLCEGDFEFCDEGISGAVPASKRALLQSFTAAYFSSTFCQPIRRKTL
ncbi:recombinase family protein [Buttiauxella selenatireducens]|uniref:Recombinase family protein n=1 Tax=Buttiauxella selenatireducens TaxID=3073902 RepID=A0ABY9SGG4_9ENTR|nr:recombinase family protein [Buttiauxella sp. R73]WMY75930.1 recombinase family protein [Buttiauxella sp. R73]